MLRVQSNEYSYSYEFSKNEKIVENHENFQSHFSRFKLLKIKNKKRKGFLVGPQLSFEPNTIGKFQVLIEI